MSGTNTYFEDHYPILWGNNGVDNDKISTVESTVKDGDFVEEEVDSIEVNLDCMDISCSYEDDEEYSEHSQMSVPVIPKNYATVAVAAAESNLQKDAPVLGSNSGDKIGKSVRDSSKNKEEVSPASTYEVVTPTSKKCFKNEDAPVAEYAEANFNENIPVPYVEQKYEGEGPQSTEENNAPIRDESISNAGASVPENGKKEVTVAENCHTKDVSNKTPSDNEKPEDIYGDWEPMRSHYYNAMNSSSVNTSAPGSALLLENAPAENMQSKDIPCQFHNGRRKMCWKGQCYYYHPIYGSKDYDRVNDQKVRRIPVSYFQQLNAKDIVAKDSIMEVTMEHITSPEKFFVSCDADWKCICDTPKEDIPEAMIRRNKLENMMTEELLDGMKYMTLRFSDYIEYQLVAVKRVKNKKVSFSRAVILEGTADINDFEIPAVEVQLLDTGAKIIVKFIDICHLPSKYVAMYPPLAYQCSLHGISPICEKWTPEAISYFKELLCGKRCILQVVKSTKWPKPNEPIRLFEDWQPYQVELRIPTLDPVTGTEKYKSVADILASKFHGVLWSLSPYRPSLRLPISRPALSVFGNTIHCPERLKKLYEREEMRIQKAEERERQLAD